MPSRTVIVAGGGASGTLLAADLIRRTEDVRVTVVEPREIVGHGVAYSTHCPDHLLNVPASKMSAFADEPEHFVRWASQRFPGGPLANAFLPRTIYGEYLDDIASQMRRAPGNRFEHVRAECTGVAVRTDGVTVTCSNDASIRGDAFVLAVGNTAPARWATEAALGERFFSSAWDEAALIPSDPNETVLLLGTGLTAVDAVLGLRHNGHLGPIVMVSRRGLLPHEHRLFDSPPAANPEAEHMNDLLSAVKQLVKETAPSQNWRMSVDAFRARTNELWQAMTLEEQRRFIRHAIPYWNVHRHRMAPEVAKTLGNLIASDTLRMIAGRTGTITSGPAGFRIPIRLRNEEEIMTVDAGRVINCSGPEHDFSKLQNPIVRNLLGKGLLNPLPLGIGADIAPSGALRDREGTDATRLFAIGPVRYGTLIETTAIPEIRAQARDLASALIEILCKAEATY